MRSVKLRRPAARLVPLVAVLLAATACGSAGPLRPTADVAPTSAAAAEGSSPRANGAGTPAAEASEPGASEGARTLPSSHVHAVSEDPGTGDVLVATHEGLYVYGRGGPHRVGPKIDLMGFTVAGPKHYLASGHPAPGVDLPQPVGLIESRDGGQTWTVLSQGGVSDFHALAAGGGTVAGFDGALRVSTNGRSWKAGNLTSPPRSLAVSPDGRRVLATTADGLMASTDGGSRWSTVEAAPLLLLVDWAQGETVAGLGTDGRVYLSRDGGTTWNSTAVAPGIVQAMGATGTQGTLAVVAATAEQLVTWTAKDLAAAR